MKGYIVQIKYQFNPLGKKCKSRENSCHTDAEERRQSVYIASERKPSPCTHCPVPK